MAKRPCRDFDNATVLVTQWEKEDEFQILWKVEPYSYCSKQCEITSGMYRGGPKSCNSWQFKMDTTKIDGPRKEYYGEGRNGVKSPTKTTEVYLMLKKLADGNNDDDRKINFQIEVSILDANNLPIREEDVEEYELSFKDFSEKGVRLLKLTSEDLSACIENDVLKIHCAITTYKGLENIDGNYWTRQID